jgi:hypothetical protein
MAGKKSCVVRTSRNTRAKHGPHNKIHVLLMHNPYFSRRATSPTRKNQPKPQTTPPKPTQHHGSPACTPPGAHVTHACTPVMSCPCPSQPAVRYSTIQFAGNSSRRCPASAHTNAVRSDTSRDASPWPWRFRMIGFAEIQSAGLRSLESLVDPSDARVLACQRWNWKVVKSGVLSASRFRLVGQVGHM